MYCGSIRLSVVVFIGFVMLAGIVVNNAIVMVDYIGRLRRSGLDVDEAIRVGAAARLRPILMTTLTTILGLVPFTGILSAIPHPPVLDFLLGSGQGQELRGPLAWTVIAGLGSSTLLTLFVVPVLYRLLVGRRAP
jgi:HAE1 family hydrophobic/amphiphilic exporter-1